MKSNTKDLSNTQSNFMMILNDYIIHPLNEGFFGFGIFLSVLACSKFFSFLIGNIKSFTIDDKDVILSSVGFICLFLISILNNFNSEKN
jgi:ABC-type Mn2+/Zn2+ transport system permease subunit